MRPCSSSDRDLSHNRVESPVHHSGLPLQPHQEAVQGVGGRCDSLSQTVRPLPRDGLPQALQPGRVLAHQELHGEVEGVQNAREGGDKGLLGLDAAQLGVDLSTLARWEQGKVQPSHRHQVKLTEFLDMEWGKT